MYVSALVYWLAKLVRHWSYEHGYVHELRDVEIGSKLCPIGPLWEKSGTY